MIIRDAREFCRYWARIQARTDAALALIPAERFDWSPAPGTWSFADLIRHLASLERYMFAENVRGQPSRYPGHGPDLAEGRDAVLALRARLGAEAVEIFEGLGADDLARECRTPGGASLATWKWLRAMVEHHVHHRGQIFLMLRLLGVEPPRLYGLTSEEVRERSVSLSGEPSPSAPPRPPDPDSSPSTPARK